MGALCRFAHASGRHPASSTVAGITGTYRLLIYHLIASSVHHQSRHKPSIFHSRFPSHLYILPCTQRWQGSSPVPRSRSEARWYFQLSCRQPSERPLQSFHPTPHRYCSSNPRSTHPTRWARAGPIARAYLPPHPRRAIIAHVDIQADPHERRRGPGPWPLTNLRQRLKVTLKIIDNAIYSSHTECRRFGRASSYR